MKIPGWLKKKSKLDARRDQLVDQIEMATEFYRFARAAYDRGFEADLIIKVDGQQSLVAVSMREGKGRELFEYLVNWAARERLMATLHLEQFDAPQISRGRSVKKRTSQDEKSDGQNGI